MSQQHVSITCGSIFLEGILHEPEVTGRVPGVVVCHPHPAYGGNMTNIIVVKVCQAMVQKGFVALRFNFRGAGRSDGHFDAGVGEREDVRAAISFLEQQPTVLPAKLGLLGYSFGATVGIRVAAHDPRVKAFVGISLPSLSGTGSGVPIPSHFEDDAVVTCTIPRLFIVGEHDEFAPLASFYADIAQLQPPVQIEVIPGATHFWTARAAEAADKAAQFLAETLLAPMA